MFKATKIAITEFGVASQTLGTGFFKWAAGFRP